MWSRCTVLSDTNPVGYLNLHRHIVESKLKLMPRRHSWEGASMYVQRFKVLKYMCSIDGTHVARWGPSGNFIVTVSTSIRSHDYMAIVIYYLVYLYVDSPVRKACIVCLPKAEESHARRHCPVVRPHYQ